ncbi:1-deoxy-D-xylulose-5-phosphate synthase [Acetanaerobacterium elongatum]|uniref:1-deoxy-D-xylulose-5-phosphate synthase n=1 Tax=Acetanaerobacterium elongatum TaxID=258515 RepID=A0A1H0AQA8_9FIRM|nr:1-deoxy-D-xylulose-5-phosphate synthase [Acetanaerobacterium elongatum]SDN35524.1 1-deoxy-D-xylulose-5-phosphate synthase [Acetanaerobacterium elongatum]
MDNDSLLRKLNLPEDLKKLNDFELNQLCIEIREVLIETISQTGGHLASNLGMVELTVAIHTVFDSPQDRILFDVGHQCYTHKLLTGRLEQFSSLRQENGISGFPKSKENIHDAFISGHAGNAISAACGIAAAKRLNGEEGKVLAIVGDGSFTNGLTFEGMNNTGKAAENLIVILNDNEMSISKNVGALAKYLAKIRSRPSYFNAKDRAHRILDHMPLLGDPIEKLLIRGKTTFKELLYHSNYFEAFGFTYLGPVDGHDLSRLKNVLLRAKALKEPVFIHVDTVKGKGFASAEENPGAFHGIAQMDLSGKYTTTSSCETFSTCFGQCLLELADKDDRICAITAAMKYATGLNFFYKKYKERFFDVGIAEEHGVTFAAGLATGGKLPVFAVYSTFLQRAYDEVLHDAAIEQTHIVLAVDRAGIVGDDGETHQGLFDVAFLSSIPGITIFSPFTYAELQLTLKEALYNTPGVVAVRYPRGSQGLYADTFESSIEYTHLSDSKDSNLLVITYGREFSEVLLARDKSTEKFDILKLTKITPIPPECVTMAKGYQHILFIEEGIQNGSVAEHFHTLLAKNGYTGSFTIKAVDNCFVTQASVSSSIRNVGLDSDSIVEYIKQESLR